MKKKEDEQMVEIPLSLLIELTEGYRVLGLNTTYMDEIIKISEEEEEDNEK